MKQYWIILCCVTIAALVALGLTVVKKNEIQDELMAAYGQVNELRAKWNAAASDADTARTRAEEAGAQAAEELTAVKAEAEAAARRAEEELNALRSEAEAAAQRYAEELAQAKAEAEAAARRYAEELAQAKAEAETAARRHAEELAQAKADADAAAGELAQVKAEAEAAAAKYAEDLALARSEADAAAAKAAEELTQARSDAEAAVQQSAGELARARAEADAAAAKYAEELARARSDAEHAATASEQKLADAWDAAEAAGQRFDLEMKAAREERDALIAAALRAGAPNACILYASGDGSQSFMGDAVRGIQSVPVVLSDYGAYTARLTFDQPAKGLSFSALAVRNGENAFPHAALRINAIRVNGADAAFTKGYTATENGADIRMNLYNTWVGDELPDGARSFDGSLDGASAVIVSQEAFASVQTVEIDFELLPAPAGAD